MPERIIVTGATGMLGSSLIKLAVERGDSVTAIVRKNTQKIDNLLGVIDKIKIVECDADDYEKLPILLNFEQYDKFFHFAWMGTFGTSRNDGILQENNIRDTLFAIKAAKTLGCTKFVGAGSQAEYGNVPYGTNLKEDIPCNPDTGYGIAKLCAGKLGKMAADNIGIEFVWTRILSVYGIGDNITSLTQSVISDLLDSKTPATTLGEQIWDLLYCDDAAEAFYLIGKKGIHGKTYVIGSGKKLLLRDVFLAMKDAVGANCSINIGGRPYNAGQTMYLVADISNLKSDTGFEPKISLNEGVRRTVKWLRDKKRLK